jgi:hypothetical protein
MSIARDMTSKLSATEGTKISSKHLQRYYLKHTTYFSIWVATYFHTTYILLPTLTVVPKTVYLN